jgi:DNA processing protein
MNFLNKKLLYLLSEKKIKPSRLINTYKNTGSDMEKTVEFYMKKAINEKPISDILNNKADNKSFVFDFNSRVNYIKKNNISLINISEAGYPCLLKEIDFPPPLIFYRGDKTKLKNCAIAIVGTRKFSPYGRDAAAYISRQLSKKGITIISGMATGIDYFAQRAALEEKGGSVGVLGCGIDKVYPESNRYLYDEIVRNGGLLSEYIPGTPPLKRNFPARNRIISGISMGVIVVEAREKSGALITGDFAMEQNREVFAIPGSIFSDESRGCHLLIKNGAKLIEDADDVIIEVSNYIYDSPVINDCLSVNKKNSIKMEYSNKNPGQKNMFDNNKKERSISLGPLQKKVFDFIGFKAKSLEEIVSYTGLNTGKVLEIISELKFSGVIFEKKLNEFIRI